MYNYFLGGKIGMLVENLDSLGLQDPDSKRERREASVNYFVRALHSHNLYVAKYIICEILNLVNVLCQIYFMDYFLGGQFLTYGMDVLNISEESFNERVDPMSKVFPKVCRYL